MSVVPLAILSLETNPVAGVLGSHSVHHYRAQSRRKIQAVLEITQLSTEVIKTRVLEGSWRALGTPSDHDVLS